jgi:hypothetical protein
MKDFVKLLTDSTSSEWQIDDDQVECLGVSRVVGGMRHVMRTDETGRAEAAIYRDVPDWYDTDPEKTRAVRNRSGREYHELYQLLAPALKNTESRAEAQQGLDAMWPF